MNPTIRTSLTLNGNIAHSTGWWWYHAAAFYFSGSLYYDTDGTTLVYNAGRDQSKGYRRPCLTNMCATSGGCDDWCPSDKRAWIQLNNSKAFLTPSNGLNSWSGRMEVLGFEAHDMGLSLGKGHAVYNDLYLLCVEGIYSNPVSVISLSFSRLSCYREGRGVGVWLLD
jgi:hypothetical protein